ncbi:MAG: hypothetical protein BWK80_46230 [Desulfobacteraceae bacterium IS3]|nr:MAG: hypothetical protein BWK80_46230 [Desulfobacteraceae bacterium IS3]
MTNKKRLPLGISDFKEMREGNYYFADNSLFIHEVIAAAKVMLIPRPRRFGKTLNLSMLRYFFEKSSENRQNLFDGLHITEHESFRLHHGKYPVIWLTFKDIKSRNWKESFESLKLLIYEEYARHRYLLEDTTLFAEEKIYFENILNKSGEIADYERSLIFLCNYLNRFYHNPAVILIDEYDTPLYAGYNGGYYEDIVSFMRNFLSGGLKDNPRLFKGVVTGILRVAKESIFSGLNNMGVYTLLGQRFSDSFGFTEYEVKNLLETYNMQSSYEEVSKWYNGYLFGKTVIYNPWSVISYIDNQGNAMPYWVNTADTSIIARLATRGGREIREELGQLIEGKSIQRPVYETIVIRDLEKRDDLLWSFLLFCGYLKPSRKTDDETWELTVPNHEVRLAYRNLVKAWFSEKIETNCLSEMIQALETGNIALFEQLLRMIFRQIVSYHDMGNEPEKVCHALVLGMLVWMSGKYEIRSNRESGYGRYDLMMKPKDRAGKGIILEFKKIGTEKENAHEQVLKDALEQIENCGYTAELESVGIKDILKIAVAFRGKELWVAKG